MAKRATAAHTEHSLRVIEQRLARLAERIAAVRQAMTQHKARQLFIFATPSMGQASKKAETFVREAEASLDALMRDQPYTEQTQKSDINEF